MTSIRFSFLALVSAAALASGGQAAALSATSAAPARDSLISVSCPTTSFCMAVGRHSGAGTLGLAETWNGSTWRRVASPGINADGVSCRSASFCMASASRSAAQWNGKAWRLRPVVPKGLSALVYAISCPSTTSCIAVGTQDQGGGDSFGAVWHGKAWTDSSPANECATFPEGPACGELSISCLSVTFCMAAGAEQPAEDDPTGDGEIWNGTGWLQTEPPDSSVSDVSCASTAFCMGTYTNGPASISLWTGGDSWQTQAAPGGLVALSCPHVTLCMAVTDGGTAQRWNGSGWQQLPMPRPGGNAAFGSVTCRGASFCMAVGSHQPAGGGTRTLAELWDGTSWRVITTP